MAKSKDKFLPFEEARLLARTLGLKTMSDWQRYYKNEVKPNQLPLPVLPNQFYKDKGWISWQDWLGESFTPYANVDKKLWRKFEAAKVFALSLNLNSQEDWKVWAKSDARPSDIPFNPDVVYNEFITWSDFLGYKGRQRGGWLDFKEARAFARTLSFKTSTEWRAWAK